MKIKIGKDLIDSNVVAIYPYKPIQREWKSFIR